MPQAPLEGDPNPQEGSLARGRTTLFRRHRPEPGSSPGTLTPPEVHVEPRLRFFRYGPDHPVEEGSVTVAEAEFVNTHCSDLPSCTLVAGMV